MTFSKADAFIPATSFVLDNGLEVIADLGKIFKTAKIEAVICNGKKSVRISPGSISKTYCNPPTVCENIYPPLFW